MPTAPAVGAPLVLAARRVLIWPALGCATAALWSALARANIAASDIEAYVLPPAVALIVFAAVLIWLRRTPEATAATTLALVLGLVAPAITGWSGDPTRGTIVAVVSAALCLAAAWTPIRRSRGPALVLAGGSLIALALVALERVLASGAPAGSWLLLLVTAAFGSAAGLVHRRLGASIEKVYATVVPPLALAAASLTLLPVAGVGGAMVTALTVLGVVHLLSAGVGRVPVGAAARWTSLAAALLLGSAITARSGSVIEAVSIPTALVLLAGAALAMRRCARRGLPWPGVEYGIWLAGIAVAIVPSVIAPVEPVRVWIVLSASA